MPILALLRLLYVDQRRNFGMHLVGKVDAPLMTWKYEEIEQFLPVLINIVGYDAIKKRAEFLTPDINKPLGSGVPSQVRIIGGEVRYGEHKSSHPLFQINALTGTVGQITGKTIGRAEDGRLLAVVAVRSPYQQLAELNKLAGLEDYGFYCAKEFISSDPSKPTIFQNVVTASCRQERGLGFCLAFLRLCFPSALIAQYSPRRPATPRMILSKAF